MATDTALLGIDRPVDAVGAAEVRAAGTPIVVIQHADDWLRPGAPAWRFLSALTPAEGELVIRKRAGDAFSGTPLREELTARGVRRRVVTGVQTDRCARPRAEIAR